jgi:hypothetical protein
MNYYSEKRAARQKSRVWAWALAALLGAGCDEPEAGLAEEQAAPPLAALEEVETALARGGAGRPISLVIDAKPDFGWAALMKAIGAACEGGAGGAPGSAPGGSHNGKTVALDLSRTTLATRASKFNPFIGGPDSPSRFAVYIKEITLPDEATSIASDAFKGFDRLDTVIAAKITDIGAGAFTDCAVLEVVNIPKAQVIGEGAFAKCTALKEAAFPAAVEIGDNAFSGCAALEALTLPADPPDLGSEVFADTGGADAPALVIWTPSGWDILNKYEKKWQVKHTEEAGGNIPVYGNDHKTITIRFPL